MSEEVIVVEGNNTLAGEVRVSGAKNSADCRITAWSR